MNCLQPNKVEGVSLAGELGLYAMMMLAMATRSDDMTRNVVLDTVLSVSMAIFSLGPIVYAKVSHKWPSTAEDEWYGERQVLRRITCRGAARTRGARANP